MTGILEIIKAAAVNAVRESKPLELVFGLVVQEEDREKDIPLLIQTEQKKPLTRAFFIENGRLDGLREKERLVLLQIQGGQKFYILDILPPKEGS